MQKPIRCVVGLPAEESLRSKSAVVDPINASATHTDDSAVADADVERAAMRAEHARRLHPLVNRAFCVLVYPDRPIATSRIRSPRAPGIHDPVRHDAGFPGRDDRQTAANSSVRRHAWPG